MLKKFWNFLQDNLIAIEFTLCLLALWWSFILGLSDDTFQSSHAYDAMAHIAPQWGWSVIFGIVAISAMYGLLRNQWRVRMVVLLISTTLWFFVATMFALGNLATTATGTYFIIGCLNAYVYYKVGEKRGN